MTVKRRDFQKIATTIHQFLLKLTDTYECAELRDSLNMSLLQLQKYYRKCQQRLQHTGRHNTDQGGTGYVSPRQSLRITLSRSSEALSPMTPYIEEPQYFHVHWTVLDEKADQIRKSFTQENLSQHRSINTPPIHYAASKGDFELLNELFLQKKDVLEDQDCLGRTPLMYAVYYDQIDVVRWLLKRGSDPNSCDLSEITSLHWACYKGNIPLIELLLDAGANINYQDSFGRSASHWACTCESTEPLQLLIEFESKVNQHDRNGLTPSMWACRLDHLTHLTVLSNVKNQEIDHIDGFERDRNGRTIVHWAVRRQQPLECLKYLLNEQTIQLKDDEGKTVLLLASEQGALETCKVIIEKFGTKSIEDVDDNDRTSLILATSGGHGEVVNFLLENGANLKSKDKSGASCMDIARNQYLFYCQLIISSHLREKERKRESIPSDCVELIEKVNNRHNSISETRTSVKTPPRPPTSPKSQSSQASKSPTLKHRTLKYSRNKSVDNEEMPNGFDAMSADSYGDQYRNSLNNEQNFDQMENQQENSFCQNQVTKDLEDIQYQPSQTLDVLNNETGHQYHESLDYVKSNNSVENSNHDVSENKISSNDQIENFKPIQRAKKINRFNSGNKNKSNPTTPDTQIYRPGSPELNQDTATIDAPLKNVKPNSNLKSLESFANDPPPKINYGASLEPIRKMNSSEPVIKKRKKKIRENRLVAKSHDRLENLGFGKERHSQNLGPLNYTKSLENISNRLIQLPNGVISNRHSPNHDPFPLSNNQQSVYENRNSTIMMNINEIRKSEHENMHEKVSNKHIQPSWLTNGMSRF